MTVQELLSKFFSGFNSVGDLASVILTLTALWAAISKKPKEKIRSMIREEAKEATKEMAEQINAIDKKVKAADETDLAILRNTITHIYFKYKDSKKIPHYEKENLMSLYCQYEKLGGNSYIKTIVAEMADWEEIV